MNLSSIIDLFVSILPKPLLIPAVRLLKPKLYHCLKSAKGITHQEGKSVITFECGHIVIDQSGIKPL